MTGGRDHSRFAELLPAFALGSLSEEERREVAEHLETCDSCRRELAAWEETVYSLAQDGARRPAGRIREELLRLVETEGGRTAAAPPPPRDLAERPSVVRKLPWLVAAALAVLAVGALAWGAAQRGRLGADLELAEARNERLREELAESERALGRTRSELATTRAMLDLVASAPPDGTVRLAGLGPAEGSRGRLFVDARRRRGILVAEELPQLPEDRVYQLWTISGGRPSPAGVFRPDAAGGALLLLEEPPEEAPDTWAVTVEPAGGVPEPTGDMVLKS